jgi:hypothetical protein
MRPNSKNAPSFVRTYSSLFDKLPNLPIQKIMGDTIIGSLLNPTAIGKHFDATSQKVNLVLSELGFIEHDIAGWRVTKLGVKFGGQQKKHHVSGASFVLWPPSILNNKNLVTAFGDEILPTAIFVAPELQPSVNQENFRHRYPANYRTRDGHFVRSKSEVIIDDWLYTYGLVHAYERKLPINEDVVSDFHIPSGPGRPHAVYIEYWGMESDTRYKDRMIKKIELYRKNELPLIELGESDIQNLDDVLPRKLLEFKIKVG